MIAGLVVAYGAEEGADARTVAELLNGIIAGSTRRLSTAAQSLAKRMAANINAELLPAFDDLPSDLGLLSAKDKSGTLNGLAKTSLVSRWFSHLLNISTTHQVQSGLAGLAHKLSPDQGSVIIKSPVPLDANFKKTIRKHFKSDFVTFVTDISLLGGIMIYRNGRLMDHSWLGKIKSLATVKTSKS